jgi:hypothetical protein
VAAGWALQTFLAAQVPAWLRQRLQLVAVAVTAPMAAFGGALMAVADTGVGIAESAVPGPGLGNLRDRLSANSHAGPAIWRAPGRCC